jgi:glycerol-3-phosphate acyltransferase PlsY
LLFYVLLLLIAVGSYVLGGVNGALIVSIGIYKKDIRQYGSGNAGLTNFYRVFGKRGALLVILIDIIKTLGPVLLAGFVIQRFATDAPFPFRYMAQGKWFYGEQFAGFFVMFGHCFPVFYKFAGGKGVLAVGTILLLIDWRIGLIGIGTFALIVLLTRYVSLGAIIGIMAYPICVMIPYFKHAGIPEFTMALLTATFIIARHRENILRLIDHKESKFSFHRKKE